MFKCFELFRDSLCQRVIDDETKDSLYKNFFIAPEVNAREQQFKIKGQSLPFVCLWQSSPVIYGSAEVF